MDLFNNKNYMTSLADKVQNKLKNGGPLLAAVRTWIQWNVGNGEYVTWGSDDVLCYRDHKTPRQFTVKELESIAEKVAEMAYYDAYSTIKYEMRHAASEYEIAGQTKEASIIREAIKLLIKE